MRRNFAKVMDGDEPVCWLGANFWSRRGGPLMWREFNVEVVKEELATLRAHGLNITRSFFYWPDFHPEPDLVDETLVARYRVFLDLHSQVGMRTIPTFIVGHMSGENWDPAWRAGRDLYSDVWMVSRQAWFAGEIARRFKDHPAVAAWLLSNEMPIYGAPATREVVTPWVQAMVNAIRAAGATQPISTGDGAWGVEITGHDNGFSVREISRYVDFVGPHVYRMETDIVRQHTMAGFITELCGVARRPIVLEEFGVTTDFASAENAGHYYRQLLHNTLLAGSTGWIAWNNTDYDDLYTQPPYSHHAFEMHFGITDSRGNPKAPLFELRDFAATLDAIDVAHCHRPDVDTAILVPSYFEVAYPFSEEDDRAPLFGSLHQAYIAAREADLPVALVREADEVPNVDLLIVPSAKQLTAPTWHRLHELAAGGATVYLSYCAGTHSVQRGPWYADVNGLFGVRHQLVYGINNPIEDDVVEVTFVRDFGAIPASTKLRFRAAGTADSRAFLPVEATDAEVVAVDARGRPVLTVHPVGNGRAVLCTYPFEHMASLLRAVNPEPTHRIYDGLATVSGVRRDVSADDPRILSGELAHDDGRRFIWFISQASREVTMTPRVAAGLRLRELSGAEDISDVSLPPFGVRVLQLEPRLPA